ncbi:hypothetical protein ACFLQR_02765, partial [Verrucomicrobiota bacterium]
RYELTLKDANASIVQKTFVVPGINIAPVPSLAEPGGPARFTMDIYRRMNRPDLRTGLGSSTPGRYHSVLKDGKKSTDQDIFIAPGISIGPAPSSTARMESVRSPTDSLPSPYQPKAQIKVGAACPPFVVRFSLEEHDKRFLVTTYHVLPGTIDLEGLPASRYTIGAKALINGMNLTVHRGGLYLNLPPTTLQTVNARMCEVHGRVTAPPFGNLPRSITFSTKAGSDTYEVRNKGEGTSGRAGVSARAPLADDGTFKAYLFKGEWIVLCRDKEFTIQQKIEVKKSGEAFEFVMTQEKKYSLRVNVLDEETGEPINGGEVFAVIPVAHSHGIGGFVSEKGISSGMADFGKQKAMEGYSLYARAKGYMNSPPAFFDLTKDTQIDLRIKRGGVELNGKIINKLTSKPVSKVPTLGLYLDAGPKSMLLDYFPYDEEKKEFRIPGLRPGKYHFRIWGYKLVSDKSFEIKSGQEKMDVTLHVTPE